MVQKKKESATVEVGATVKFYPTHNKALELVGTIEAISDDVATVTVETDGKFLEVSQTFTIPLREVRIANEGDANRHVGDRG